MRSFSLVGYVDVDGDEEEEEIGEKSRLFKRLRLMLLNVMMRICVMGYKRWVGNKNLEDLDWVSLFFIFFY